MPRLSDEEMAGLRAAMARRKAVRDKKAPDTRSPIEREALKNVQHYEVRQLQPGTGLVTIAQTATLAEAFAQVDAAGRLGRCGVYAVGLVPSRGPGVLGSVFMARQESEY